MSEAELHQIRMRLHQGELQKAARGELRLPLPGGLIYDRSGHITLNPDEEVQARLRLVFAKFRDLQSARGVMLLSAAQRSSSSGPPSGRPFSP